MVGKALLNMKPIEIVTFINADGKGVGSLLIGKMYN
jgi:hypothetical protein